MPIKNVNIDHATPEQLRAFATDFLNLEIADDASDEQVSSAIDRAQPGVKTIFVLEADEQQPAIGAAPLPEDQDLPPEERRPEEAAGRAQGSLGKDDPRWVINIPIIETEDGSGSRDVMVGVNGRAWQMQRGHDINVPHRVVVALDNAVEQVLRHDPDTGDEIRRSVEALHLCGDRAAYGGCNRSLE
jgi:hypothetical protein